MKKNESKYFYTASLMQQALLLLLEKKDIDFISVTEIAAKAGVSRSTFYLHYDNVYELLEDALENLNKEFLSAFVGRESLKVISLDNSFLITEEYLIPYLNFCKQNKRVLKLVHQKPQLFHNDLVYKKMYDTICYPAISLYLKDETQKVYNLEFFTRGVVGVIRKWIELDCETEISELMEIIKNCIGFKP